jgi:hypothetical protein
MCYCLCEKFKFNVAIAWNDKLDQILPGKINVLNLWKEGVDLNFGLNDLKLEVCCKIICCSYCCSKRRLLDVLVTAQSINIIFNQKHLSFRDIRII